MSGGLLLLMSGRLMSGGLKYYLGTTERIIVLHLSISGM